MAQAVLEQMNDALRRQQVTLVTFRKLSQFAKLELGKSMCFFGFKTNFAVLIF
jgi:hypothetical protein